MSFLSFIAFILVITISTAKHDIQTQTAVTSAQNFKELVTNMIREQSTKIQSLLKKIQANAQSVLERIESIKQDSRISNSNTKSLNNLKNKMKNQIELPILQNLEAVDTSTELNAELRSFNNHYASSAYGVSGYANYGAPTYHHHSIGFDPINIVISMSLLSFLLQALQGLLTRTRFPTQVIEARNYNPVQEWPKIEDVSKAKDKHYWKRKHLKKYLNK